MMNERSREIAGFLCRWCLLGMAGVIVLAATCAAILATSSLASELRTELTVPDFIGEMPAERPIALHAYVDPPVTYRSPPPAMAILADGSLRSAVRGTGDWLLLIRAAGPGLHHLTVKGMPYGPLAFLTSQALVRVIPERRAVFLVDARLASMCSRVAPRAWGRRLDEMWRRGEMAFFWSGRPREFRRLRAQLHVPGSPMPLLATLGPRADYLRTLQRTQRALNVRGWRNVKPTVVTADEQLAGRAAKAAFPVELHNVEAASGKSLAITVRKAGDKALALQSADPQLSAVAGRRRCFLIDARWLLGDKVAAPAECLAELQRRGGVVFLHPGPLDEFVVARAALHRVWPQFPICCLAGGRDDTIMASLQYVAARLARQGVRQAIAVTGDVSFASSAARRGFVVHLVGRSEPNSSALRGLKTHASAAKFKEFLAAEPIGD